MTWASPLTSSNTEAFGQDLQPVMPNNYYNSCVDKCWHSRILMAEKK